MEILNWIAASVLKGLSSRWRWWRDRLPRQTFLPRNGEGVKLVPRLRGNDKGESQGGDGYLRTPPQGSLRRGNPPSLFVTSRKIDRSDAAIQFSIFFILP